MRRLTLVGFVLAALASAAFAAEAPSLNDESAVIRTRIQQNAAKLKDVRATVNASQVNRRELEKMGKIFAETYQFKKADVCFKAPDRLKMNGQLGMVKVEFINSGKIRQVRVPSMGIKKKEDISDEMMKQMTSLDVGVVSARIWDLYKVSLLRTENTENGKNYVIRIQADGSKKSQLIWVDSDGSKLLRRDRLNDDGKILVKSIYTGHKLYNGVWVPTKAEIYNGDGKLAAVTETTGVAVNTGVNDKEFEI